eukprot:jgi/Hompol1/252/HPOL_005266-RA
MEVFLLFLMIDRKLAVHCFHKTNDSLQLSKFKWPAIAASALGIFVLPTIALQFWRRMIVEYGARRPETSYFGSSKLAPISSRRIIHELRGMAPHKQTSNERLVIGIIAACLKDLKSFDTAQKFSDIFTSGAASNQPEISHDHRFNLISRANLERLSWEDLLKLFNFSQDLIAQDSIRSAEIALKSPIKMSPQRRASMIGSPATRISFTTASRVQAPGSSPSPVRISTNTSQKSTFNATLSLPRELSVFYPLEMYPKSDDEDQRSPMLLPTRWNAKGNSTFGHGLSHADAFEQPPTPTPTHHYNDPPTPLGMTSDDSDPSKVSVEAAGISRQQRLLERMNQLFLDK